MEERKGEWVEGRKGEWVEGRVEENRSKGKEGSKDGWEGLLKEGKVGERKKSG